MFLETDTLYLRAIESSDLNFLYTLENDVSVWQVSNTTTPYSKEALQQYIDQAAYDIYTIKQLRLIICSQHHEPVGAIDLFDFDPKNLRAGIGITIAPTFRRQHFASQSLALLLSYCHNYLLLHQVYCTIAVSNEASLKLFKQADFKVIGVRKDWIKTVNGWLAVYELQKILNN
ncbi:GNAT family N-acetyltransferase [Adhaeribacter aquaticus]|uniref:GNAT family N-acetyltransferase n=1 Tax=Adhaeribacter aquaticus TaxID=299567 RepID=UPI0004276DD4|nr:GNAT family protein [Adhaeribacter aquaticus]